MSGVAWGRETAMSKTSEAHRQAAEKVDRSGLYTPLEAAKLAKRHRRRGNPSGGFMITSTETIERLCG
jgi:hypothetical protein